MKQLLWANTSTESCSLSLGGPDSRALFSLRFAESWCSAPLVWQASILWDCRHVSPILPHQSRDGHSTEKREQFFWVWKRALVWQPVVWEHTWMSAILNPLALADHSSGNPRRCNFPAAKAQRISCGSSIDQEVSKVGRLGRETELWEIQRSVRRWKFPSLLAWP